MIAVTRTLLGETSASNSYWDDTTDVKPMINDSQVHVASETEGLLTYCDYFSTAGGGGDGRFALKADYQKLRAVHIFESATNKWVLTHLSMDEFEAYTWRNPTTAGRPRVYKLELGAVDNTTNLPGDIWVYPLPDGGGALGDASNQYKIRIYYFQKPTTLTDTSAHTSELPENAHMAVCYHAAMHLSLMSDNRAKYRDLKVMYEQEIHKLRIYYNKKQRDSSVRMKDVMGYTRNRATLRSRHSRRHR
jgi:hypothetical protein